MRTQLSRQVKEETDKYFGGKVEFLHRGYYDGVEVVAQKEDKKD